MPKKSSRAKGASELLPGVNLEQVVARIQQKIDPASSVTHNEVLLDRIGNSRQCDVVIRGAFAGRPLLGIIECKDHNRRKSPDAIEAFAKKTEHLGANIKIFISKMGFTPAALRLARHEGIACLSAISQDAGIAGINVGKMWYGTIEGWGKMQIQLFFSEVGDHPSEIADMFAIRVDKKPIYHWFAKQLFTKFNDHASAGLFSLDVTFKQPQFIEIERQEILVDRILCVSERVIEHKKRWVSWTGDAYFDWHTNAITIPPNGELISSGVETDLTKWLDCEEPPPEISATDSVHQVSLDFRFRAIRGWDKNFDVEVPDLGSLIVSEPNLIRHTAD